MVTFVPKVPGVYCISVFFQGTFGGMGGEVRGSPCYARFDDFVNRENNSMMGKLMVNHTKQTIASTLEFCKTTERGLVARLQDDSWTQKDITDAIVKVREHILKVEARAEEVVLDLDRCHEVCQSFKEKQVNVSALEVQLAEAKSIWENVLKELPNTIMRVNPLVKAHAIKMKQEIQKYDETLKLYLSNIKAGGYKSFDTGCDKALAVLENAQKAYEVELKRCEEFLHLSNVFECPRDMQRCQEFMQQAREILDDYKAMWELIKETSDYIARCKETFWQRISPEGMEEVGRGFTQKIKKLSRGVRESNAYQGLERMVKDFIKTCPLISALRQPAMRDRHWKELMQIIGTDIDLPSTNPQLRLKQVLDLELHNYSVDVEDIVDKAAKELKQEECLTNLEKTWANVDFQMSLYKDTDTPLLKLAEQDFETLETDQMTVQTMVASRYVYFKAQSVQWQRWLSNIADVLTIITEIQRVWSYLEPLFIGSEEVKSELAKDAQRFAKVDVEVRATLKGLWKVRKVKEGANEDGLYAKLEAIQKEQELCKKSLVEFLDGKRRLFPRFYFTSEVDLLDILSNGSNPAKILKHVEKVLLATKTLELQEQEGARPSSTKVKFLLFFLPR